MDLNLHELDSLLFSVRKELDYQRFLTPINFYDENKRFISEYNAGKVYNPKYEYNVFESTELFRKLGCIDIQVLGDTGMEALIKKDYMSLIKEIRMYDSLGTEDFSEMSSACFGEPNRIFESNALETIKAKEKNVDISNEITPNEMKELIEEKMERYGFNWKIVMLDNMASRISVEPEQKALYINNSAMFSDNSCKRLLFHEVDTHVLRAENGMRRGWKVLFSDTPYTLKNEEGLALYNEYINGVQDEEALKLYAARFIACLNISESFYSLFDMLVDMGCPKEQSLYVVSRIKRGISDTDAPGGFNKDYLYYQGFQEVKKAIEADKDIYNKLYYASINIDDISLFEEEIRIALDKKEILTPIK